MSQIQSQCRKLFLPMRCKSNQNTPTFPQNLAKYGIRQDKLTSMMLEQFFFYTEQTIIYDSCCNKENDVIKMK